MLLSQSHLAAKTSVYVCPCMCVRTPVAACVSAARRSPPRLRALIFLSLAELMAVGFGQGEDVAPFQN